MVPSVESYGLDVRCSMMLDEYRELMPVFEKIRSVVYDSLQKCMSDNGLYVNAIETRIKSEASLAGKLELKGSKYSALTDITDLVGARVITFYSDEVDKIASLVDKMFEVDWANSVDKRKMHELDSFGYLSLHYVCRIPKTLYSDPQMPMLNEIRFEVQMRTALQHVWAVMNHDTGYKSGVEVPREHLRNLGRLAGMLELADEQFSHIRTEITNYRRQVQALVSDGRFDEVSLNGDTFRSYLKLDPFGKLTRKIASINQAEIHETTAMPYLEVLKLFGFKSLGDVEELIKKYSDTAYRLAVHELGSTDLDIVSSTIGIQNLAISYVVGNGGGLQGLKNLLDTLGGNPELNQRRAERILSHTRAIRLYDECPAETINLDEYEVSGNGFTSAHYNHRDGKRVIKLYADYIPIDVPRKEYYTARKITRLGINIAKALRLVTDGTRYGVEFEMIRDKKSIGRLINEHPAQLTEYAATFAKECRKLHATECDRAFFPSAKQRFREVVMNCRDIFDDSIIANAMRFIDKVPEASTCLHGDMHLGNVLGGDDTCYWIDLSDFGYGNPNFDLGMVYLTCKLNDEDISKRMIHLSLPQLGGVWEVFVAEYFNGTVLPARVEAQLKPFAALIMMYFATRGHITADHKRFVEQVFSEDEI